MKNYTKIAVTAAILSMVCVQGGASIAKQLFPAIGPIATSALRIGLSAILLYFINRPNLRGLNRQQWFYCGAYGLGIAAMNLIFYMAIQRIPLGLGVTIEFIGPLFLAFALSRKLLDVVWALLACLGILLIVPWQSGSLDPLGLFLAFLAGTFWAVYIVMGSRVSKVMEGRHAVSVGMIIATIAILPFAIWDGALFDVTPSLFGMGLLVAILSSALPFSLDMVALKHLPAKTFSILTSLQPAFGALSGLLFLKEYLTWTQWASVACVVLASIGTTVFSKKEDQKEGAT
ncbi:EamA family transporter [Sphingobacterium lactis]|uniref:Inner membrane transporter RhtA n=1 Tax=Sphingobacterium lactis TaxID=797291 RepID=A0A1H5XYZ7_9SPHI|nr:DMT family transporter [Sphingobacterium lactis]SEG16580.1 inner membrane transporter RhtA [Sphingobacterium lactis]